MTHSFHCRHRRILCDLLLASRRWKFTLPFHHFPPLAHEANDRFAFVAHLHYCLCGAESFQGRDQVRVTDHRIAFEIWMHVLWRIPHGDLYHVFRFAVRTARCLGSRSLVHPLTFAHDLS